MGHEMGVQLLFLMAMGLASLYMMHLLAQDYMKIRRPVAKALGRAIFRTRRDLVLYNSTQESELKINWELITQRDPVNCLHSLICQIAAKDGAAEDEEAFTLRSFVKLTYKEAPDSVKTAFSKGLEYGSQPDRCYQDYPFCLYSAKTMLGILKFFTS